MRQRSDLDDITIIVGQALSGRCLSLSYPSYQLSIFLIKMFLAPEDGWWEIVGKSSHLSVS